MAGFCRDGHKCQINLIDVIITNNLRIKPTITLSMMQYKYTPIFLSKLETTPSELHV